jgi:hypothetical protein
MASVWQAIFVQTRVWLIHVLATATSRKYAGNPYFDKTG